MLRLLKDTGVYAIAVSIDRLTGFLVLPLLTKSLDQAVYGAWNQVLVTYGLLSNFVLFGFYYSILRYVPGAERDRIGRIFYGMLAVILINCAGLLALMLLLPSAFSRLIFATDAYAGAMPIIAGYIVSEVLFEFVVLAFLRADGRVPLVAAYYLAKSLARIALLWHGVMLDAGLAGLLLRLMLGNLLFVLAVYWLHIQPRLPFRLRGLGRGFWREVMSSSAGIVMSSILAWANSAVGRYIIVYTLGLAPLGVFAANYALASIAALISMIACFTVPVHLNAAWNSGDKAGMSSILTLALEAYVFVSLPLLVVLGMLQLPLMTALTAPGYIAPAPLIWLLVTFLIVLGLEQILTLATYVDNTTFSVRVRILALIGNVVLSLMFVDSLGIMAVALATLLSTLLVVAINLRQLRRLVDFQLPWRALMELALAAAAMATALYAMLAWLGDAGLIPALAAAIASGFVYLAAERCRHASLTRQLIGKVLEYRAAWGLKDR